MTPEEISKIAELARELEWLEANTTPVAGEDSAVKESWGNVSRLLSILASGDAP